MKSQLHPTQFGPVTEYALPSPVRSPNAITTSPDGSVWFGEEAVPGVGHLYPNGTLVEYPWPFKYPNSQNQGNSIVSKTDVWGIALWNGKVWASDVALNQLVAVDPSKGKATSAKLPTNDSFPYTMTVGPDNSLWFTELYGSKIGRVYPNGSLIEYSLSGGRQQETPAEVTFQNTTLGYYVNVGGVSGRTSAGIFAFNPQKFSPTLIKGTQTLGSPDSISLADGQGMWVALHGPSMVDFLNLTDGIITTYPTSTINYTNTVLPYFIRANGSASVWFNEHYANRIAVIDLAKGSLTEYSESNPPAKNATQIDNVLTFALGKSGAWFTSFTGNFVGYVDASFKPGFSVALGSSRVLELRPGQATNVTVHLAGESTQPLSVEFSDSESSSAVPKNITFIPSMKTIPSLHGEQELTITLRTKGNIAPGTYALLVTIDGGLIRRSVYLTLRVTA